METLLMITSIMMDGSVQTLKQKKKRKTFLVPYLTNCINTNFYTRLQDHAELGNGARFNVSITLRRMSEKWNLPYQALCHLTLS